MSTATGLRRLGALTASIVLAAAGMAMGSTPAQATVDVYITPGTHTVNGRVWRTSCEPYSSTERCRTEIQATVVKYEAGRFVPVNGWAFNNLTYKASPRSLWTGNPIAANGKVEGTATWTSADGRQWRTECDTAVTGQGGCRSYIEASVIAKTAVGYEWRTQWLLNNMVRFSAPKPAAPTFDFIKDPALRSCVKAQWAISSTSMVICDAKGVKTLEGIQRLAGLTGLQLLDNEITDLSPLANHPTLSQLDITHNLVDDLTPLAGVRNLEHLKAYDNLIEDLRPLAGRNLWTLDVGDNLVTDLSPLAGMRNLWTLGLGHNYDIQDISPLRGLTNLTQLDLQTNSVDDLTPLRGLTNLTRLDLTDNFIDDISPLAGLTKLGMLFLRENYLGDVAPLKGLTSLEHLWLAGNPSITNLAQLKPLADKGCQIDIWP
ncbi:leucine-rich repeat domain-containing protein [Tessaracoccus sp. MC1756]|uniref:leucine-rich repeat domain-containing protein n=1 Tax=Tessaracoccus sp. MC1756 TaxID=2760311 RepID=UPI00160255A1|nr:leucine-rich repeat domain-containing protein [Tessaracoccus sp. MC1756]MBB1510539.1 leucine-rich repeat domain-containing protein [Tessaracoccus sp. MC1756]